MLEECSGGDNKEKKFQAFANRIFLVSVISERPCMKFKTIILKMKNYILTVLFPILLLYVYVPPLLAYVALLNVCVRLLLLAASGIRLYVFRCVLFCAAPDVLCVFFPVLFRIVRVFPITHSQMSHTTRPAK